MKKFNKKKTITVVTGAAVLGVAVTALGNASELETLFNPSKFEKFQNQNKSDEYDYMSGDGENVDLADKNKNSDENAAENEQQALQVREEPKKEKSSDSLGIIDQQKKPETSSEDARKTGVELDKNSQDKKSDSTARDSGNKGRTPGSADNSGQNAGNKDKKDDNGKDGKDDNSNKDNKDNNNKNDGNKDDNLGNNNNQNPVTPEPVAPTATPSPTPTPVPKEEEWLKPRDPYKTEDGKTLKSIEAEITREYYCKGDKFSPEDAVVTAVFEDSKGNKEQKVLSYGGEDGYKVSLSTNLLGNQTAVFTYKGISKRAAYKVLRNSVTLKYMAFFADNDGIYGSGFPCAGLKNVLGEDIYGELSALADVENCQPVSGSVIDLREAHSRMIGILGDESLTEAMKSWATDSSQNIVTLKEDQDGYLQNMLEGFQSIVNMASTDDRSYIFYPVYDWGSGARTVVNIVKTVPSGYKIRRVLQDRNSYKGDQVLEQYTGEETELSVPMGVTKISLKTCSEKVTSLVLPQSVQTVDIASISANLPNLTSYKKADNLVSLQDYSIRDGLLYSRDGKTLLSVPAGCKEVTIPDTVKYLGEGCFGGLSEDAVIHFQSKESPKLKGETGFKGKILVADSEYDTVCKNYMFAFGKECQNIIFGSENGESDLYTYLDEGPVLVYRQEQNVLAGIPEDTKGEYTVTASVTSIGEGAFAGCEDLTDIVLGEGIRELRAESLVLGEGVASVTLTGSGVTVSDIVFGDPSQGVSVPDIRIYVKKEDYEDYLKAWSEVLDPVYGKETAAKLLMSVKDSYIYEDGIKYQEVQSGKEKGYRLIRMYQKDKRSCKIKENTVSVDKNAFSGCENLEIVYIPSSVKNIQGDCFAGCSSLETVACDNAKLFANTEMTLPESTELMVAGEEFAGFEYEDGILNGTREDGSHVLLNVVTDYSGQVNIKENTTAYYKEAFKGCKQLTGIYDPSPAMMKEIGENCFEDCEEITYFDFSDCPGLTTVGAGAFRNCTALSSVKFSESVETIGQEAFYGCVNLTQISMPGVQEICDRAFYECDRLRVTGEIDHLTRLGDQAFYSCRDIRSMELPESLEYMGEGCFENCTEMAKVTINGSLTGISRYCFYGCKRLTEVTFNDSSARSGSLRVIGVEAFAQCTTLEKIDLSNLYSMEQMGEGVFRGCTSLTTVRFPEYLQKIPDSCFDGCTALSIVQLPGSDITELGSKVFGEELPSFVHVWVDSDKVSEYKEAYRQVLDPEYGEGTAENIIGEINDKAEIIRGVMFEIREEGRVLVSASTDLTGDYIVPDDTVRIEADAFAGCDKLEQLGITYNTSVSLGDRCFKGCKSLNYVDIEGSIPEWGEETFMDCPSLAKVYIGAGINNTYTQVDRIGTRAFKNCTALEGDNAVGVRTGVKIYGEECFAGCEKLGAIGMVAKSRTDLESIEDKAFYGCTKLRVFLTSNLTGLKTIGAYAFSECDTLTQPSVPAGVNSIGEGCFMNCDNIKYVSFYGGMEEYPKNCFRNCSNLIRTGGKAVAFTDLKRIGDHAYAGCSSLQSNTSWNPGKYTNLEELGDGAFSGCSSLSSFALAETLKTVGNGVFDDCTGITAIVMGATEPPSFGSMSLSSMSTDFTLFVPNSQSDGDSVYRAYLEKLTELLGEKDALRILDSVSDGAKARYEEELKKLTPTPSPEPTETPQPTEIPEEEQEETGEELTPTPSPEEEPETTPEDTPQPTPEEDGQNKEGTQDKETPETSEDTEKVQQDTETQTEEQAQ